MEVVEGMQQGMLGMECSLVVWGSPHVPRLY